MGNIQSLPDLMDLIRRRLWLIALIFLLGAMLTLVIASQRRHNWESVAVLQMELPRVAGALPGTELSHSMQRFQLLEQKISSRDQLLDLAQRHRIFADAPELTQAQQLERMRHMVRLEPVRAPGQSFGAEAGISAVLIRATMPDPMLAAEVANDLARQVLDSTADRQSTLARDTLAFFAREEERITKELADIEAEITAFKDENLDALPENLVARRTEMQLLEEQKLVIERELFDLAQELAPLTSGRTAPRAIEQRRIETLEARRAALQTRSDRLEGEIRAHTDAIARTPLVESRLGAMLRRQQQVQDQYSVINRRRAEAETTQRLESDQQTERFTLLEAALPADYPLASGRRKIVALGGLLSGALALAIAFALEMLKPVVRTARQTEALLGIRPVIALPDEGRPPPRLRRKR